MDDKFKFVRGSIVDQYKEIEIIQLEKDEIEKFSFSRLLKEIKNLDKREDKGFSSLMLAINGYDDIPKEIYEIEDTREYLQRLIHRIPFLLFYISPINEMPMQIITSLSDFKKFYSGPLSTEAYKKGNHQVEVNLSTKYKNMMTQAIERHVRKIGFADKNKELPILYKYINGGNYP